MTYPFDLPAQRGIRMGYVLGWMRFKQIPLVDGRMQSDTHLARMITSEAVSLLGEDLVRDHLLETLELHLGTRLVNDYYPRLSLVAGQRFASRGGCMVRWDESAAGVVAHSDRIVP